MIPSGSRSRQPGLLARTRLFLRPATGYSGTKPFIMNLGDGLVNLRLWALCGIGLWTSGLWTSGLGVALAGDWSQWRGADRNGVDSNSPPLRTELPPEGLRPLWLSEKLPSGNEGGWSSPIIANGRVYLFIHERKRNADTELPPQKFPWLPPEKRKMTPEEYTIYEKNRRDEDEQRAKAFGFKESVLCLDGTTGQTLWKRERPSVYTRFVQSGTPTLLNGRLYLLGAGRVARCLDAENGSQIWETKLPGEFRDEFFTSSFAIADGTAVILAGHLFGLDISTGELLWQGDPAKTSGTDSSPVLWRNAGKNYVIANVAGKDTVCVEPRTGQELWRIDSQARQSTPVVVGDLLITYGSSREKGVRCFQMRLDGAEQLWVNQGVADKGSSPVVVGQQVFVQGERRLVCLNLSDGKQRWATTLRARNPQYTSLIAGDQKVFYACGSVLGFTAQADGFQQLFQGEVDKEGLLAEESYFQKLTGLDRTDATPDERREALQAYEDRVGENGPLVCSSPALADGLLVVRLRGRLACYDLRAR